MNKAKDDKAKTNLNTQNFYSEFDDDDEDEEEVVGENLDQSNAQNASDYDDSNNCKDNDKKSGSYSVDVTQLKQFGEPEITTEDAALDYLRYTERKLYKVDEDMSEARALVFFAILWKLHKLMDIKQRQLVSRLRRASGKCRDTVYRYVCVATVESQLKIIHGEMSVQALMELYRCQSETRGEILEIAIMYQKRAEAIYAATPKKGKAKRFERKPKLYPSLWQVELAVKHFKELEKMRNKAIATGEDPNDVEFEYALPRKRGKNLGRKVITVEKMLKMKFDPEELEENGILANVEGHFARVRQKEKILKRIDSVVEHGSIKTKRRILDAITARPRDDRFKFYITRLLAYNDSSRIQKIKKKLERDIKEFDKHHAELS
jgi:hypothetical protein